MVNNKTKLLPPEEFKAFCSARIAERIIYDTEEYTTPVSGVCFHFAFDNLTVYKSQTGRGWAVILKSGDNKALFMNVSKVEIDDSSAPFRTIVTVYCHEARRHRILIDWKTEKGGTT